MKLTKNQNMQQQKNPAAADGIIIKNPARKHPAPELCQSITQPISTKNPHTVCSHKLHADL